MSKLLEPANALSCELGTSFGLSRFEVYYLNVVSDLITIRKRWDRSMCVEAIKIVEDMFEALEKKEKELEES